MAAKKGSKSNKSSKGKGRKVSGGDSNRAGRNDIVRAAAKSAGLSQVTVLAALEAVLGTIRRTTASGVRVTFNGFGTWETRTRAARRAKVFVKGTRPGAVKQVMKTIPEKVVIRFRPSAAYFE